MNKPLKIYHGQATIDKYARYSVENKDYVASVQTTSLKRIKEAYKEFMDDLIMESQEAY